MAQNVIYSDVEIYILLLLLTTILHLLPFFFFFSKKTLSSTFPLYKVKENSPVEQLIKKNLVLNRNKVLRAREKKNRCVLFSNWNSVSFLNNPLWTLIKKKELLSDDSSGNCRTSYKPKKCLKRNWSINITCICFQFFFPNFSRNFSNLKTRHFHCFNSNLFYCKEISFHNLWSSWHYCYTRINGVTLFLN